jgi:hypothetical protein
MALALVTGTLAAGSTLVVTPGIGTVVKAGAKQQFSVTSAGGGVPVVYWTVSGAGCSGFGCGNITITGGLYTAPATISGPTPVTITATSVRDFSTTGSVTITINPASSGGGAVSVSISPPATLQLNTGASETFVANVVGAANIVTWSVGGLSCGSTCGTITQTGAYTAPSSLSRSVSATITATSQANPSASASVTVLLTPVVGISMGPFNSQMIAGSKQQLTATVTGSTNLAVKWSVSGTTCGGLACGTITTSGLYTAPISVSPPLKVTVTAAAQADPSKTATAPITVGPIVSVSVATSGLSISINAEQQYTATVIGASNPALNWTVSGPGCSGVTCGMVSALTGTTALYQAPASIPSPATVNITATLVSDSTKSDSAIATIVPLSDNRLNGQYAFLFRGYDTVGTYQAAGSFTASFSTDGNGNPINGVLTNGVEDINCGGTGDPICTSGLPVANQPFTGTYTINADGRGMFTIIPSGGPSQTFTLAMSSVTPAMSSANTKARFIESDTTSGIRGSGVLEKQDPSAFTASALGGGFAFSLSGVDSSSKPIAAIGLMGVFVNSLTNTPVITSGVLDENDNGVIACFPPVSNLSSCPSKGPAFQKFSGTYSIPVPSANGRGTANFSIQGFDGVATDFTNFHFSMYVISSKEFFLLSMDPGGAQNPVFGGQALQQQLPPLPATPFSKGASVFSWSGWSAVPSGAAPGTLGTPQAAVGRLSMNSSGQLTSFIFDINQGGSTTFGGGRGVCDGPSPTSFCTYSTQPNQDILLSANKTQLRVFLTSLNSGFLLGMGPGVTVGRIESQVPQSFPFPFMFGSDLMVATDASLISGTGSLTQSVIADGPVMGNEDESQSSLFSPNLLFNGKYGPPTLPNGQGLMYLDPTTTAPTIDFWIVSPYKMMGLGVEPGIAPNVIIFEQ